MEKATNSDTRGSSQEQPRVDSSDLSTKKELDGPGAPELRYTTEEDVESGSDTELLDIAWKYKWLALLCVCAFPLGQNCMFDSMPSSSVPNLTCSGLAPLAGTDSALGPLKATLRKELSIDNTQYGTQERRKSLA
jgi:hypothetical protein